MKKVQSVLLIVCFFFAIQSAKAQYGGNNYGNGGYGNNGRMSSGMSPDQSHDTKKEISVEETISKLMVELKPALSLDALQEIAISNILIDSFKSQTAIMKSKSSSQDEIMKDLQVLSENTERRVNELLNNEQKEKYSAFMTESKNPKKNKKKR